MSENGGQITIWHTFNEKLCCLTVVEWLESQKKTNDFAVSILFKYCGNLKEFLYWWKSPTEIFITLTSPPVIKLWGDYAMIANQVHLLHWVIVLSYASFHWLQLYKSQRCFATELDLGPGSPLKNWQQMLSKNEWKMQTETKEKTWQS